jgi:hypothetical protein
LPPAPKTPEEPSGEQEGGEKPDGEEEDDWRETENDRLYKRNDLLEKALGGNNSACSGDMSDEDLMWGTGGAYGSYGSDDDYY